MRPIQDSHLYQEIHQQPQVLRRLLTEPQDTIQSVAESIRTQDVKRVFIAARGTSDNAARYAKYLLGAHNQMDVSLATPSLFTVYDRPPDLSGSLVMGISQSGKSPDIVSVLTEGRKQGALTAAITNTPQSDLGKAADFVLDLQAGKERSLAATKTYTAQLATIVALSLALTPSEPLRQAVETFPDSIEAVFGQEDQIRQIAERYRYMSHCVVLGRGFNYATVFEFSLKMKELTYIMAEPYSSADFLHGPVALVGEDFPVFVIAPSGKMTSQMGALVEEVRRRGAEVVLLSDSPDLLEAVSQQISLPRGVPEWLSPLSAIIPGQLFTMSLAHTRGIDVDQPRGLSKVTETW